MAEEKSPNVADEMSDGDKESPNEKANSEFEFLSDVVTGVNVRKSDNIFQAVFTLVSLLVSATVGAGVT